MTNAGGADGFPYGLVPLSTEALISLTESFLAWDSVGTSFGAALVI